MYNKRKIDENADSFQANKHLRNAIAQYQDAEKCNNTEEKRKSILKILEVIYDDGIYKLDGNNIFREDEQYRIASDVIEIVTGEWKPTYGGTQKEWNEQLTDAVEQGDIILTLKLVKVGKRLAYLRNTQAEHTEYLNEVKKLLHGINREAEKDKWGR